MFRIQTQVLWSIKHHQLTEKMLRDTSCVKLSVSILSVHYMFPALIPESIVKGVILIADLEFDIVALICIPVVACYECCEPTVVMASNRQMSKLMICSTEGNRMVWLHWRNVLAAIVVTPQCMVIIKQYVHGL
jgi:hypothetical protein